MVYIAALVAISFLVTPLSEVASDVIIIISLKLLLA
jgi:hypothetical protein